MKFKITVWCEDPETNELDDSNKPILIDCIKQQFQTELGIGIIDIEVEESHFDNDGEGGK